MALRYSRREYEREASERSGSSEYIGDNVGNSNNNSRQRQRTSSALFELDDALTSKFAVCASKRAPCGNFRPLMRFLEYSAHGVPWLVGTVIVILTSADAAFQAKFVNLLSALLIDIIIVAVIKGLVRRRRPEHNIGLDFTMFSVDFYSFPSGHASRAIMVMLFMITKFVLSPEQRYVMIAWGVSVSISRILLGRHYVSDVMCGMIIGILEFILVTNYLWLSNPTCHSLIKPVTNLLKV